jgi:hypothetical protein
MGYLPPDVVTKWSTVKSNANTAIGKVKADPPKLMQGTIDTVKQQMKGFDSGLTGKLQAVNTAKTPEAAALAIKAAMEVISQYKLKIGSWGMIGQSVGAPLMKTLTEIQNSCQMTLNALKPHEAVAVKQGKGRF